ncbi:MAG TPA: ABC transporter ATP-binding protein [Syntrophorhabdales bacterium]|nr:ABC transporter ATP-binding protein [Syntrophorhabdales bacterium]
MIGAARGLVRDFLYRYVARYRHLAFLSLGLMLVVAVSRMAPAYILKVAIDRFIKKGDFYGLSGAALLYLAFICLEYAAIFLQIYVSQFFGQSVIRDMRLETFTHLLGLPVPYFDRTPHGKNLQYVTNDMENINEFITSGIVTTAGDVITIVGILAVMFYLSKTLTAVVILFFLVLFPLMNFFRKRFHQAYEKSRESVAEMNAYLGESLSGVYVAKAFDRGNAEKARFSEKNEAYMLAYQRVIFYLSLYFPFVESIGILSILAILWASRPMLAMGAVTFGTIAAFIEYSHKLYNPIRDLSEKYNLFQNAQSSLEKLHKLHRMEGEEEGGAVMEAAGDIELRDVWLSYDGSETYALKRVTLKVREGERIGIVGLTGSGKTSLINLLLGFYRPTKGEIYLGGRPLTDYSLEGIRKAFGIVSQDVFIFPRTVRENLFVGESAIDPAVDSLMEGFLKEGGLQKMIAEDGLNLSEGEKQLIAIGRVVGYRPRYLILDEATSRVDRYLEEKVKEIMTEEFSSATWLVIAHRISTMAEMDRIIVIHDGELAEEGSHGELLEKGGIYRNLYDIYQRGGEL